MHRRNKSFVLVSVAMLVGLALWLYFGFRNGAASNHIAKDGPTAQAGRSPATAEQNQKTRSALQMLVNGIKSMGWKEVPPTQDAIQQAIASKDSGEILRAFHDAVYGQGSRMAEAIPAIKNFLNDPDPWVRYQAAEKLYIAGDNSGLNTLVDLMQSDNPIQDYDGNDMRVSAAGVLEKYRENKAINALIEYCRKIGSLSAKNRGFAILDGLALTARGSLSDDLVKKIESSNDSIYVMYNLMLVNPQLAKDLAQSEFEKAKDGSGLKLHAAWAMLEAGEKDPYYSYLMDYAKVAIAGEIPTSASGSDVYEFSLKILASIKDPEIKSVLEDALNSKNTEIIDIALVNLFFNQGGSDKARQYLLSQFNGPTNQLVDSDFLMQLAAAINDPQINAAAASVDQRTESSRWAYFSDRKNWSVYTWIDDYVVDLNGSR